MRRRDACRAIRTDAPDGADERWYFDTAAEQFLDALAIAVTLSATAIPRARCAATSSAPGTVRPRLPAELIYAVEGRGTILELADDLVLEFTRRPRLHGDEARTETGWTDLYG